MYNNVLLLLESIKQGKYIQYTDYNVSEYHLKEFYNNHNNRKDIMIIKIFFGALNYDEEIKKIENISIN